MNDDVEARRDLEAAATVHAARRAIDDAIAELAARPLDEQAADRMRAVLAAPTLSKARTALRRLSVATAPRRTRLSVVTADLGEDPADEEPERAMPPGRVRAAGGAA